MIIKAVPTHSMLISKEVSKSMLNNEVASILGPIIKPLFAFLLIYKLLRYFSSIREFVSKKQNKNPFPQMPFTVPAPHWLYGHINHIGTLIGQEHIIIRHADPKSGVSTFWGPAGPMLSVLKASHAREVLRYSPHRKQVPFISSHFVALLGKKSLINIDGKEWTNCRKIATHAMKNGAILDNASILDKIMKRTINSIRQRMNEDNSISTEHGYTHFQIETLTHEISYDVFGLCFFGCDFGCTNNNQNASASCFKSFDLLINDLNDRCYKEPWNPFNYFRWIPTKRNRNFNAARTELQKFILGCAKKERSASPTSQSAPPQNVAQFFYENGLKDDFLNDMLLTFFFAGFDTTSIAMTYLLYMVAKNPHIQQECALEVSKNIHKYDADNNLPLGTLFPYCKAVLMETLRLFPPAANTARNLSRNLYIPERDISFEQGTRVVLSLWFIHRYEDNFHRALEFLPQRWVRNVRENDSDSSYWVERTLPDDESQAEKMDKDYCAPADKKNFFAFAYGKRHCVGEQFAMKQLLVFLVRFLEQFELDAVDGYELKPMKKGPLQRPMGSVPMIIRERKH